MSTFPNLRPAQLYLHSEYAQKQLRGLPQANCRKTYCEMWILVEECICTWFGMYAIQNWFNCFFSWALPSTKAILVCIKLETLKYNQKLNWSHLSPKSCNVSAANVLGFSNKYISYLSDNFYCHKKNFAWYLLPNTSHSSLTKHNRKVSHSIYFKFVFIVIIHNHQW